MDRAQARYAGDIHLHERRRPHGRDQGDARQAAVVLREERNGNYDNDDQAVIVATVLGRSMAQSAVATFLLQSARRSGRFVIL